MDMDYREPWMSRLEGIIDGTIAQKSILIVGCGSVGSFIASQMVRSGIKNLTLIDPDVVEQANLTRSTYILNDVGKNKVTALKQHLEMIARELTIKDIPEPLQSMTPDIIASIENCDLILSAVDDPAAAGRLNSVAFSHGKPAIYVGLYKQAKGGEVIVAVPATTPCYHCSTGGVRRVLEDVSDFQAIDRQRDYGNNRLTGEVALGADIHFVCCAATKIALSQLNCGQGGQSIRDAVAAGTNYVIFGMEPDYHLFKHTHASAAGQHMFQSVWLKTEKDDVCSICSGVAHD